jgi:hypothetical protein
VDRDSACDQLCPYFALSRAESTADILRVLGFGPAPNGHIAWVGADGFSIHEAVAKSRKSDAFTMGIPSKLSKGSNADGLP